MKISARIRENYINLLYRCGKMLLKNRYHEIRRVKEIISVFIKYGFYNQIHQLGLLKYMKIYPLRKNKKSKNQKFSRGKRLRMALEELGPAFVKLGQLLSTRRDLIPKDMIEELENLQNKVVPISYESIKEQVEKQLQGSIEELFLEFKKTPLAAASIAQVHKATLKNGKKVVVKVQRPGIQQKLMTDLSIIEEVASFLEYKTKYGKLYDFTGIVKDFKKNLLKELDFRMEGRNIITFQKNFKNDKNIVFPCIYKEYSSQKVLTMDFIQGISLKNVELLRKKHLDPSLIARRFCHCILEQILRDGFFHGDPHPGNVRVLSENRIAFLDMGIVGKVAEEKREQFFKMIAGITLKNSKLIVESIREMGVTKEFIDFKQLENEISILRDEYLEIPLKEIKIGEFLTEIFRLAFQYNISIPNEVAMIAKTLIIVEGTITELDPNLNILEIAQPITKQLMKEMYSFQRIAKYLQENILDTSRLLHRLPDSFTNILERLERHDFKLILSFKNEKQMIKTLNKIANQLSFSIALLALGIVISGFILALAINGNSFGFLDSRFVIVGLIISLIMGLWLMISIIKSGRF